MNNTAKCPLCGEENELKPHPTAPARLVLICPCHPQGPVLETDAPAAPKQTEKVSKK